LDKNMKRKKIGLALGGGGARGLAHIGVLKVLQKNNLKIDYVTGTSIGAIVGAYFAMGLDLAILEQDYREIDKKKILTKFLDLGNPLRSILQGKKIYDYIKRWFGEVEFKDTAIPLKIISCDLISGQPAILDKGKLMPAIQASYSVPGIFPPVKIGDQYLIDGGVVESTPAETVKKMGADLVIAVDLIIKDKMKIKEPNIINTLSRSYEIIRNQSIQYTLAKVKKDCFFITPEFNSQNDFFDFTKADEFIKIGEKAAEKALPKLRKIIG